MEKTMPGERWLNVDFNFKYANDNRIEVSNFGRIRSFNRLSDGNILEGSMINGYKILKLKFFAERAAEVEKAFAIKSKQILKLTVKLRQMKKNEASKEEIKEATKQLETIKLQQKRKLAEDWKARATNYHALIHKLVAQYFLKQPSESHTIVGHLDYNKLNNRVSNLKWMTQAENVIHQRNSPFVIAEQESRKTNSINNTRTAKLSVTKVMLLKKLLNEGKSIRDMAKRFKVTEVQIYRVRRGENWGDIPAAY